MKTLVDASIRTVSGLRFIIRRFSETDALALAALFAESVREIGSRHYSQAQISAWAGVPVDPERFRKRAADGRVTLVAECDDGGIIAFGDIEADGHIDLLYCAPRAAGRGVTAELYNGIEEVARKQGISRLYSEASEAARRFFVKQGFVVLGRRDFEINGVPIHNYAVEKILA